MDAAPSDVTTWAADHAVFFNGLQAGEIAVIAELWRHEAESASGIADLEAAGSFRLRSGAGEAPVPEDFCLALTADRVVALEFDSASPRDPSEVKSSQLGAPITEWPRRSVRISAVRGGDLTLEADGATLACRAFEPHRNPASMRVATLLGLELSLL